MIEAFSTNPMQRGMVQEAAIKKEAQKVIAEGMTVKDHRGDKWTARTDLVRNETHPLHWKQSAEEKKKYGEQANKVHAWHNQRTNEVHEGGVTLSPGGHATIGGDSYGSSRFFHLSHYDQMKEAIKDK
jgi:hypothetical protein